MPSRKRRSLTSCRRAQSRCSWLPTRKSWNRKCELHSKSLEVARTGRPGPVVVDVPKDIQNWTGIYRGQGTLAFRGYSDRLRMVAKGARLEEDKRTEFFDLLARSKRPLLYAGGGIITAGATAELRQFSERYGIPVVTTLMGLGAMSAKCELWLGMHGMAFANYAVEDCDFLIAVGARFDDRVAGGRPEAFAPGARYVAHIDIDEAEINKVNVQKQLLDGGWESMYARQDSLH
jgi:acetolactate synthase-1/2/3 large subunit